MLPRLRSARPHGRRTEDMEDVNCEPLDVTSFSEADEDELARGLARRYGVSVRMLRRCEVSDSGGGLVRLAPAVDRVLAASRPLVRVVPRRELRPPGRPRRRRARARAPARPG